MPKYLIRGAYTPEGVRGVLQEGGTGRRKAAEDVVAALGGTIEAMYFAFGDDDVYIIVDGTDNIAQAAGALLVNASGAVNVRATVLLTPEEIDEAAKRTVPYRPPGH